MTGTSVTLIGNAAAVPTTRTTASGIEVCSFSLASQERRRLPDGTFENGETTWYRVSVWRDLGKHVAASVRKGDHLIVIGTQALRVYTDGDGKERTSLEVTAQHVALSLRWASARSVREAIDLAALLDGSSS